MRPPGSTKRTYSEVAKATKASAGIIAVACQKLHISRQTYYRYLRRHPQLEAVREEAKEDILDLSEAGLVELIKDKDRESIKFFLKCHGKSRGWVDSVQVVGANNGPLRHEVTGASGGPLQHEHSTDDSFGAIVAALESIGRAKSNSLLSQDGLDDESPSVSTPT